MVDLFWDGFLDHFILLRIEVNLFSVPWIQQILLDILCSRLPDFLGDIVDLVRENPFVESVLEGVVSKLTLCLLGDVVVMIGHLFFMWFLLHLDELNLLLLFFFHISSIVDDIDGLFDLLTSIVGLVPSIVRIDKLFTWRLDNW